MAQAVREAFAAEAEGPTAPPQNQRRLAVARRARQALAELIGASPEEVSLQQNTTEGINIVLGGLGLRPGDEVIICTMEHPSVVVPAYYARERQGVALKIVQLSAADSPADIVARFQEEATPALKLIVLSHIAYATGQVLPIRELSRLAHDRGGYLLLDAAQSVGQIPVAMSDLECDFCAFPGHKWLLGPAATGALFVRRDLIERLQPPKISHHAAASYNFRGEFHPRTDDIAKFELTTVSVPLLAGLNAAIDFIQGIGLEAVRDHALGLAHYTTERLGRVPGIRLVSAAEPASVASGLVSFGLPQVSPQIMTAYLWEQSRIVARTVVDAGCTRLSLHVFNTEAEVDAVVKLVEEPARTGSPARAFPTAQIEWEAMTEL
ncbi:MAG: aminotransferase class V-fold PLP-dependent enzyme [Chloroflexi bacterium]|nr:aminotransferase class V-fold PLP-dependent enzyme [Chloroflexota bacterium]